MHWWRREGPCGLSMDNRIHNRGLTLRGAFMSMTGNMVGGEG